MDLDGCVNLSDQIDGDTILPCIKVFVRQVLNIFVGKGLVPIILTSIVL